MKIPKGKKAILWTPVCKAGTITMIDVFKRSGISVVDAHTIKGSFNPKNKIIRAPGLHRLEKDSLYKDFPFDIDDCYVIINTRRPYERAISGWRFHRYFKNVTSLKEALTNPPRGSSTRAEASGERHFTRTMTYRVRTSEGTIKFDYQVKLEEFHASLTGLGKILDFNVPDKLPVKNKCNSERPRTYGPEEIALVNEMFAEDFENFGYEKRST